MSAVPLVVTNNTPVSNLLRIAQLPLLGLLYGRVLVPMQVADELDRGRHVLGAWREAPGAEILDVMSPLDGPFLRQLLGQMDAGESGAIALALERGASMLLMDELTGRKAARRHGLRVLGTLGVLLDAKRAGHLGEVRPWIEALAREGFHIGAAVKQRVLAAAGEADAPLPNS
jgi:predicted nucleic acid-binding protein